MRFRAMMKFKEKIKSYYKNMNVVMFITTIMLMVIGLASIYSATANKMFFYKQIVWLSAGFVIMMVFANINYNILINMANHLFYILMFFLILVLIIGHTSLGATRWLRVAGFQFQPSEFMKIVLALTVIRFILVRTKEAFTNKNLAKMSLIIIIPMLFILKQPDLGTAILLVPIIFAVLFLGNIPIKKIVVILLIGIMLLPIGFFFLKDYQRTRINTFINPHLDPLGSGYNVIQSQIAVGSGELIGKGWSQGTQSQLSFIPIKYTDFIYAVIAEEFGFLGSVFVILIYMFLILEALKIVKLCRYTGGKMLAGALTIALFSQFAINIGMNIGLMPVTGITLPLLSYGGTSVLVTMIIIGILQNVYREYMKAEE